MDRYAEAISSCEKAIVLSPNHADAHGNRGIALLTLNRYEEALNSCDKALSLKPGHANAHNKRSIALRELKRYDEALESCDKAIALNPGYADAYNNRGITLTYKGRMDEVGKMFHKALELKPDFPNALENLIKIRKYADADSHEAGIIKTLLKDPGASSSDKRSFYFSLGKIYDDCGRYDEAFECFRLANQLCNAAVSYNREATVKAHSGIIEVFSKEFLSGPFPFGSDSRAPLFIIGMPRSGTPLLASILSNHPSVATAGELPTIIDFATRLREWTRSALPYPEAARQITPALAARLISDYEKRLRRDAPPGVPMVIDKHPINFRHLGLIWMLFPQARVVHCRRDPLDTGLSNYFQRFALSYDYSFDLGNIGHFYGEYARLMEHWRRALPLKMIEIDYEEMVTDTEKVARGALEFLGLEWDERCLAPHTNPHAVETASRWQVRQPIYKGSLERWRHYEKHLGPLKEALETAGRSA